MIWPHFCFYGCMKRIFIYTASVLAFFACNSSDNNTNHTPQPEEAVTPGSSSMVEKTCYTGNSGRDSVSLTINGSDGKVTGDKVTGSLDYRFYEKDKSAGTINGQMNGDTLFADYTFMSEGVQSVRQVAFLKNSEGFSEGYGDMEEKNGKMLFKNPGELKFGNGFILKKTDCGK